MRQEEEARKQADIAKEEARQAKIEKEKKDKKDKKKALKEAKECAEQELLEQAEKENNFEEVDRQALLEKNEQQRGVDEEEELLREVEKDLLRKIEQEETRARRAKKKKDKKQRKKQRGAGGVLCGAFFRLLQVLALLLVSIQVIGQVGATSMTRMGEAFVRGVGFGFVAQNQAAGVVTVNDTAINLCFMARRGRGPNQLTQKHLRAFDGGATWHLSGESGIWVGQRKKLKRPRRILGFDSESTGSGLVAWEEGTIELKAVKNGRETTVRIKNVLYIPEMGNVTLVSQGMLDAKGYSFLTPGGVTNCYNRKGVKRWEAHKKDGLYQFHEVLDKCLMSRDEAHRKFGHVNDQTLNTLGDFEGERSS